MSSIDFVIKDSDRKQLNNIISLLKKLDLVYEDLETHLANFLVALENKQVIGCAGYEIYEDVGLLRSVAVAPEHQGKGIGHILIERINQKAKKNGIKEFYLLTDSASDFFEKFGFNIIPRKEVDERIKKTYEYSEACPESAIVMKKNL